MTRWVLRCVECGKTWVLAVSFRLDKMARLYHYCPHCKRNTFHVVIKRVEEGEASSQGRSGPQI